MNITWLEVIDQFRFILGTIFAEVIFVSYSAKKKSAFHARFVGGTVICMILSLTYMPILHSALDSRTGSVLGAIWWFLASVLSVVFILFCYDISFGNAMFQCILGLTLQQVVTIVLRYYFVEMKYPSMPEENTGVYLLLAIGIYAFFYCICYLLVRYKMRRVENVSFLDSAKMVRLYGFLFVGYSLLTDVTAGMYSWIMTLITNIEANSTLKWMIQSFYIGMMLFVSIVIFIILFSVYEVNTLKQENELLERLQLEKEKQYEYTKENIEMINQKCHDLKHQIAALELAGDDERQHLIQETKEAVLIYDSVIKTDNEVLNTILTEKSLICNNNHIRLSCSVSAADLASIAIIDLYTILGNAIDNAIECVKEYVDDEKKIISITVLEKGQILSILVDNYFEGKLKFRKGLPMTSKKDKAYHGFGIKGIKMAAKKYGGDIRISNEKQTFSLQVMIPLKKK